MDANQEEVDYLSSQEQQYYRHWYDRTSILRQSVGVRDAFKAGWEACRLVLSSIQRASKGVESQDKKPSQEFAVGDVVQLKCGGPKMVVSDGRGARVDCELLTQDGLRSVSHSFLKELLEHTQ